MPRKKVETVEEKPKRKKKELVPCPVCGGTGLNVEDYTQVCPECGGTGSVDK